MFYYKLSNSSPLRESIIAKDAASKASMKLLVDTMKADGIDMPETFGLQITGVELYYLQNINVPPGFGWKTLKNGNVVPSNKKYKELCKNTKKACFFAELESLGVQDFEIGGGRMFTPEFDLLDDGTILLATMMEYSHPDLQRLKDWQYLRFFDPDESINTTEIN